MIINDEITDMAIKKGIGYEMRRYIPITEIVAASPHSRKSEPTTPFENKFT